MLIAMRESRSAITSIRTMSRASLLPLWRIHEPVRYITSGRTREQLFYS